MSSDKATIDERIEEIIKLVEKEMDDCFYAGMECADIEYGSDGWTAEANPEIKDKIKSLLLEVVREVVGSIESEKDSDDGRDQDFFNMGRNDLRKQILEKVRGL
jgi:hypothetical protein